MAIPWHISIIRAQNLVVKFLKLLNGKLSKKFRRAEGI